MGDISGTTGPTVMVHLSEIAEFCKEINANACLVTLWGKIKECLKNYSCPLSKSKIFLRQIGPDFQKANFSCGQIKFDLQYFAPWSIEQTLT